MKKSKIEFDILDQAYRFFRLKYPEINDDNYPEAYSAFTWIESFACYVSRKVEEVFEADIDMLNDYLKTHVPEDVIWYKEIAPTLADLIFYWHDEYLKLKYPEQH